MRSFIAIELPLEIKREISKQTIVLYEKHRSILRWVPAEKMHLTLNFLGDFPDDKISGLKKLMDLECVKHKTGQISVQGLGCFPGVNHPAVIWVGLKLSENLMQLQKNLEKAVENTGFPADKKSFSPHLTIARVVPKIPAEKRNILRQDLMDLKINLGDQLLGSFLLEKITLFKSDLQPAGALYTSLHMAFLGQYSPDNRLRLEKEQL